ncbi:MAG: Smr/MutS family protein [Acidobacteriota bacterium]
MGDRKSRPKPGKTLAEGLSGLRGRFPTKAERAAEEARQAEEAQRAAAEAERALDETVPEDEPDFDTLMAEEGVARLNGVERAAGDRTPAPGPLRSPRPRRRPTEEAREPTVQPSELEDEALAATLRRVRAVARSADGERSTKPADSWKGTPRIDLHGLPVADAVHELRSFLDRHRSGRDFRVRVVTGRGAHSGDRHALVREEVERFLDGSALVLRHRRAGAGLGGDGVLLVELRG